MTKIEHKKEKLEELFSHINEQKIIVVGDICVDEYVRGKVSRISPEAPVPVVAVTDTETRLGLSANVAQNIKSLGGEPVLIGTVGVDDGAAKLSKFFKELKISDEFLVTDNSKPTIVKTRFMKGNHHLLRVDREKRAFISVDIETKILENIKKNIKEASGIIIQDYAKGTITKSLCNNIVELANKHKVKVMADPHRQTPADYYYGVDLLKPNQDEAFILSGISQDNLAEDAGLIDKVAEAIINKASPKELMITMGSKGMRLYKKDSVETLPTFAKEVFDVTGAGDTVIAALGLCWGAGMSLENAGYLANLAAGVAVGKVGCVAVTQSEILESI